MKRKIKKIVIIVLLSILLIFIARSCVLSIARIGTLTPRDNTPFLKNVDSFSYMVDRVKEIFDAQNTDGSVKYVRVTFYSYNETITVHVYKKTENEGEYLEDESKRTKIPMTSEDLKHNNKVRKVFEKWNREFDDIIVLEGQVNFYAVEMAYALIYRENGWYPSKFVNYAEDFYAHRITFRWFHGSIREKYKR